MADTSLDDGDMARLLARTADMLKQVGPGEAAHHQADGYWHHDGSAHRNTHSPLFWLFTQLLLSAAEIDTFWAFLT